MSTMNRPAYLDASELGMKEYWDSAYEREIQNQADDPENEGTIWFSDSGAEEKMVDYVSSLHLPSLGQDEEIQSSTNVRILDVGTGNGHLLFALQDEGWKAQMVGVDYSEASIRLAVQIQKSRKPDQPPLQYYHYGGGDINFQRWDLLREIPSYWRGSGFDIVLDKGTFDAISLSDEAVDGSGRKGCEVYAQKVAPLIKPGGFLLITSCNWTEEELKTWFETPTLAYYDTIQFPTFTFGGQKGQTVSSVCFQRTSTNESSSS